MRRERAKILWMKRNSTEVLREMLLLCERECEYVYEKLNMMLFIIWAGDPMKSWCKWTPNNKMKFHTLGCRLFHKPLVVGLLARSLALFPCASCAQKGKKIPHRNYLHSIFSNRPSIFAHFDSNLECKSWQMAFTNEWKQKIPSVHQNEKKSEMKNERARQPQTKCMNKGKRVTQTCTRFN